MQPINPRNIQANFNSVRHAVPYQGSKLSTDLLSQYAGTVNYRNINGYLRSPDHLTGINQITKRLIDTDNLTPDPVSGYLPVRQRAEQIASSIPLINKALAEQALAPAFERIDYNAISKNWVDALDNGDRTAASKYRSKVFDLVQGAEMHPKLFPQELVNSPEMKAAWNAHTFNDITETYKAVARKVANERLIPVQGGDLYRGLHFQNTDEFNRFKQQHASGEVVEYPAFTSTTSKADIQAGFSSSRRNEHPVLMEVKPLGETHLARDVRNSAEGEWLYQPQSRFKVVQAEEMPGEREGLKLVVQETMEPTRAQARASSMMGNLKAKQAQQLIDNHKQSLTVDDWISDRNAKTNQIYKQAETDEDLQYELDYRQSMADRYSHYGF